MKPPYEIWSDKRQCCPKCGSPMLAAMTRYKLISQSSQFSMPEIGLVCTRNGCGHNAKLTAYRANMKPNEKLRFCVWWEGASCEVQHLVDACQES